MYYSSHSEFSNGLSPYRRGRSTVGFHQSAAKEPVVHLHVTACGKNVALNRAAL